MSRFERHINLRIIGIEIIINIVFTHLHIISPREQVYKENKTGPSTLP